MKNLLVGLSLLVALEGLLRGVDPGLGKDLWADQASVQSPFILDSTLGYEPKPASMMMAGQGPFVEEHLNSEGFRGPEYALQKPAGRRRIVALGDSATQVFSVSWSQSWEKRLEDCLNEQAKGNHVNLTYDVINAGVGGYYAWQMLERLKKRGLKYEPDVVMVLGGWNDLLFSSLPDWRPRWNLAEVEMSRRAVSSPPAANSLWSSLRLGLYRYSYVARLVRDVRNALWNRHREHLILQKHRRPTGKSFNEYALRLYIDQLEQIRRVSEAHGAHLAIVTFPTLLSPERLDNSRVERDLLVLYATYWPLSTQELWHWYLRYQDALRQYAVRHPDVLLVDASAALGQLKTAESFRLFTDYAHLSPEGQDRLARLMSDSLAQRGWR